VLRSQQLGCEVIPRLSSAHNFSYGVPLYRFLCQLQFQGIASYLSWRWGSLGGAPFLPRVRCGRVVLTRARWNIDKAEIRLLAESKGAERFREAQVLRGRRRLPRFVVLEDGDNEFVVDLNNVLSIEAFVHQAKRMPRVSVTELFPGPDELTVRDNTGKFVHEIIVPFTQDRAGTESIKPLQPCTGQSPRRFAPGSEWLYAKIYTSTTATDRVLRDVVGPLVRDLQRAGILDRWFFIRYGDPDWHVRLRLHGRPASLCAEALPLLRSVLTPLLHNGTIWRVQMDTYERETERYGGGAGIVLAEAIFGIDSDAVLAMLPQLLADDGEDARWRLAMAGTHRLLSDFGLTLRSRWQIMRHMRNARAKELGASVSTQAQMSLRFRKERRSLEDLLIGEVAPLDFTALHQRSQALTPLITELKTLALNGNLPVSISALVSSYIHMYLNRLLRSSHIAHELSLCDMLDRLYLSQLAREDRSVT
jgi:thiopeptide-type bacteriocin biosynthesis protein